MALPANHVESLVTSVLAVNGYPLEKVWNQLPGLRAQRLTPRRQVQACSDDNYT